MQVDVIWTGGFTVCRKVAALAEAHRLAVAPHVFSTALALVATMPVIASFPHAGRLEFDQTPNPCARHCWKRQLSCGRAGRGGCRIVLAWASR